jgi:hypothetical protein
MLELQIGDRVRSRQDGALGTVRRCEYYSDFTRYVIEWDDGQLSEVSPDDRPDLETRLQLWPKQGLKTT